LGSELLSELCEPTDGLPYLNTLQNITHASPSTVALFVPRLIGWLRDRAVRRTAIGSKNGAQRVARVLDILVTHGDASIRQEIRDIAVAELKLETDCQTAYVWLPALLQLDPDCGVAAFENVIAPMPVDGNGEAVAWFSRLFGHHKTNNINLSVGFKPNLILRLLRLAYMHVHITDDLQHEGHYTPNTRDDAQTGRDNILSALISFQGEEGWSAKVEMANDPLVTHLRDRLIALANEASAEQADGTAFTYQQLAGLDEFGEAPPATRDSMFALMRDRLEDLDDVLLQDTSPRELWATTTNEHLLRRGIGRELDQMANNCYTLDQESVTADEKETDIRLRSTIPEQQSTIELKVGESYSGAALRDALRNQLVKRYMAADSCRAGCLLVTIASGKRWHHPDTAASMSFEELIAYLEVEATKLVEEYGGAIRLLVKGLDLRPRIK
jgi:hypothetical protein